MLLTVKLHFNLFYVISICVSTTVFNKTVKLLQNFIQSTKNIIDKLETRQYDSIVQKKVQSFLRNFGDAQLHKLKTPIFTYFFVN